MVGREHLATILSVRRTTMGLMPVARDRGHRGNVWLVGSTIGKQNMQAVESAYAEFLTSPNR
jgi:hypothetical protein